MTIFDEFDQYSEEMLMAQYGISEIIRHEASKGQVREEFLLSTLTSCSDPKPILRKGTIADTKQDAGQLDLILCRPHSRAREIGGYRFVEKQDALCVFEVKGNCTGRDLREADAVAKKVSQLDGNTAPLYGVICYAVQLQECTILERFGLDYDADSRTYFDAALNPNAKNPAGWRQIEYPNLDFFVSLEDGKKVFLRKYELRSHPGIFRFIRIPDTPVMKNVFLMVNSLWREANFQSQRSA